MHMLKKPAQVQRQNQTSHTVRGQTQYDLQKLLIKTLPMLECFKVIMMFKSIKNVHRSKWWRICDYVGLSQAKYTVGVLAEKQRGLSKDVWDDDQTHILKTKQLNTSK